MDATYKAFLDSGRHLLSDTKIPRLSNKKPGRPMTSVEESDPHKVFTKYAIDNRPKKSELVDDIKKFIKAAEADL